MKSITQDMKFRYSLMKYCEKYGVSRASRKYNKSRSCIYFWMKQFDGTLEPLACQSRRPHYHPNQHTEEEIPPQALRADAIPGQRIQIDVKFVPRYCIADSQLEMYQYTAIDEYSRYRIRGAYTEQSAFSSTDFLRKSLLPLLAKA